MFPSRLYGALPRVVITAALLLVILIAAFAGHAHAATIDVFGDRQVSAGAGGGDPVVLWRNGRAVAQRAVRMALAPAGGVYALVAARARSWGIPVGLAIAVARQESGGQCHIRARDGGRGVMQVMPQTARSMGLDPARLYECGYGVDAGLRYLKACWQAQGRYGLVIAASCYNHGIGRIAATRYGYQIVALMRSRAPRGPQFLAEYSGHRRHRFLTFTAWRGWHHHAHRRRWRV